MSTTTLTVHILFGGRALCGFGSEGVPGEWPTGHHWTREFNESTCVACRDEVQPWRLPPEGDARAVALIEQADRGEGRHDVKLVVDYLRGTGVSAPVLAMRGLFANEGPALLRALFSWRAQGKLARWKTGPSRALAILADRLVIEYPDTTRALRDAGERDAVNAAEAAGGKAHETDLPKGPLPEVQIECQCGELFAPFECPTCTRRHPPLAMATRPMVWSAEARTYREVAPEDWTDVPPYARTANALRQLRAERDRSTIPAALTPLRQALDAVLDAFEAEDLEQ